MTRRDGVRKESTVPVTDRRTKKSMKTHSMKKQKAKGWVAGQDITSSALSWSVSAKPPA
jgi:hypothetical protein